MCKTKCFMTYALEPTWPRGPWGSFQPAVPSLLHFTSFPCFGVVFDLNRCTPPLFSVPVNAGLQGLLLTVGGKCSRTEFRGTNQLLNFVGHDPGKDHRRVHSPVMRIRGHPLGEEMSAERPVNYLSQWPLDSSNTLAYHKQFTNDDKVPMTVNDLRE